MSEQHTRERCPSRPVLGRRLAWAAFSLSAMLCSPSVLAAEVSFSGFLSVVGGKVLDGSRTTPFNDDDCPCFISSWATMNTYDQAFSLYQESRAGVRMSTTLSEALKAIVQVDAKAAKGVDHVRLEWAYLSYVPADDWVVHVGRKRLPIYYYSDFMDVGFAYPWVRPPQDLYGWEVDNFNGLTIAKLGKWGDWSARTSVFYGRESSDHNALAEYFYPGLHVDLAWRDILGADVEVTRDWLNVRAVYIQSKVDLTDHEAGTSLVDNGQQRIYGLSVNIDHDNWLMRSEFSRFDRWRDMGYKSSAGMVSVGYHFGALTPMLTYSRYVDNNAYGWPRWKTENTAITVRYDLDEVSAVKVQLDMQRELSSKDSTAGDANMLSVSYDRVF